MSRWPTLWRALTRRRQFEHELNEELAFHLDARTRDLVSAGVEPAEAARRARVELGMVESHKSSYRAAYGLAAFDGLVGDLRHAWRALRRNPVFAATAVLILGAAIGANAALFAFFDTYVLQVPAVRAPERLVDVQAGYPDGEVAGLWTAEDARKLVVAGESAFEGLFLFNGVRMPLLGATPTMTYGLAVSDNYFELLGARAQKGRTFGPAQVSANEPVLVLSAPGWRRLAAANPDVVGTTMKLGATSYTVVGVTAEEFRGVEIVAPQYWIPRTPRIATSADDESAVIGGVLRSGVTPAQAQAALQPVLEGRAQSDEIRGPVKVVVSQRTSLFDGVEAGIVKTAAIPVFAGFLLVLLVACANLANLTLARASARRRELAIRLSVGAPRWRVVRHMLVESALIAVLAAALGTLLCAAGVEGLQRYAFGHLGALGPDLVPAAFDGARIAYVLALALVATLAIGLTPALELSSQQPTTCARGEAARGRPGRVRNALLVAQIAASAVLLVFASLIVENSRRADGFDPGYDLARVVDVTLPQPTEAALRELSQVTGVRSVTAVARAPLYGQPYSFVVRAGKRDHNIAFTHVDKHYFETLGIPLRRGRTFIESETRSGTRVAIISAATAQRLWPGEDALGRVFETIIDDPLFRPGRYEVVGVAADVASGLFLEGLDRTMVYLPAAAGTPPIGAALVSVSGDVAQTRAALVDACTRIDPSVLCEPVTLADVVASQRVPLTVASVVASSLGLAALLISCIGLYGVVAFTVARRTHEIGVRIALGATPRNVVSFVMTGAVRLIAIGLAIGLPICLAVSTLIAANVEIVHAFDARSYALMPMLLAVVAIAAVLVPARRAAAVAPVDALREA